MRFMLVRTIRTNEGDRGSRGSDSRKNAALQRRALVVFGVQGQ